MRLAVNRWTLPRDWEPARCFAATKAAGFDGIEMNLEETGPVSLASGEADLAALARAARDQGLELGSLSTNLFWGASPTANDAETRQRAVDIARRQADAAAALGAPVILVVPGAVTSEVAYDMAYSRAQEFVAAAAAHAASVGVKVGVENVWNKFLLSPLEMARFLDEIDSPAAGAYFDAGNVLVYGFPEQWIRILGKRLLRLHVKDFKTTVGNIRGFVNLLHGEVPWTPVTEALAEIGYDEWAAAEVEGYKSAPELGLAHIRQAMRHIFPR